MSLPEAVAATLMPHQMDAVRWARQVGPRGYLADDPGLGKSRALLAICLDRNLKRILVFAPGICLRAKWVDVEAAAMGLEARLLEKPKDFDPEFNGVLVAAYEKLTAKAWQELLPAIARWAEAVIGDESAFRVSNPKSKRTMALANFIGEVQGNREGEATIMFACGTPVVGDRRGVVSQFSCLGEVRLARTLGRMLRWESHPWLRVRGKPVMIVKGWTDPAKAQRLIGRIALRRTEKMIKLPDLIESNLPVEINKAALRRATKEDLDRGSEMDAPRNAVIDQYITEGELPQDQVAAVVLQAVVRQAAALKAKPLAAYIQQLVAQGEPVVCFGIHLDPLRELHRLLGEGTKDEAVRAAIFTGETKDEDRVRATEQFAAGELDVICATAAVAGTGIDLVRSRRVVFLERGWRPADYRQCLARVRRISQQAGSVIIETAVGRADGDLLPCELAIIRNAKRKRNAADDSGFEGSLG